MRAVIAKIEKQARQARRRDVREGQGSDPLEHDFEPDPIGFKRSRGDPFPLVLERLERELAERERLRAPVLRRGKRTFGDLPAAKVQSLARRGATLEPLAMALSVRAVVNPEVPRSERPLEITPSFRFGIVVALSFRFHHEVCNLDPIAVSQTSSGQSVRPAG